VEIKPLTKGGFMTTLKEEFFRQLFGSKKKKKRNQGAIQVHFHFYREKPPRHQQGGRF
jgi:hypothetical protein